MDPDLSFVTQDGQQTVVWRNNELSYMARDRRQLPLVLAQRFGPVASRLDLSYNSLESLKNFHMFTQLRELVLDNNRLTDDQLADLRQNLNLKDLSLNKNKVATTCQLCDLSRLLKQLKLCFPNLEYLSLIGNPLCPIFVDVTAKPDFGPHGKGGAAAIATSDEGDSDDLNRRRWIEIVWRLKTRSDKIDSGLAYRIYRYVVIYQLPNLRILDSTRVSDAERDEAIARCCLIKQHRQQQQPSQRQSNNIDGSQDRNRDESMLETHKKTD